ncbi:uncharacterized MFS-type transporter C09D4.1-like isoform X1 [Athalia rosae]|uniref:uncharacterized MFS-type transporter C09D4.1-like isoform X1 n=1 Tax=Athalia rosae TaxID=37344 RepID=UPI002034A6BF|nr:uncharacterized MFS-type transporter C09D4.1-like isoform X1 [Athalia rosae]
MTFDTRATNSSVPVKNKNAGKRASAVITNCTSNLIVPEVRVYKRRWLMLFIFIIYTIACIGQWLQYSIINNIISRYYGVSNLAVDWTSMVFLVVFIPMVFPASYLIDKLGLRWTAIVGGVIVTLGSWIKVFSASPDRFYVTFIGQTVVSSAQVFVMSVPGRLAANWFGASEVSTATAIGLFGCQLAIATNFLLPPNIVKNSDNLDDIGSDLSVLYLFNGIFSTAATIAVIIFFHSDPPLPPSETRRLQKLHDSESSEGFLVLTKNLLTNRNYIALWHAFGVIIGIFNALGTLLNQMYLLHFENSEVELGHIGVAMTVVGMIGAIVAGVVLDKTHKFKLAISLVGALSWMGHVLLGIGLVVEYKWMIWLGAIIFGFFNGGYSTIGFEVCAEFTYPAPEGVTTAYLTVAHQLYGVIMILIFGKVLEFHGDVWTHVGLGLIGMTGVLANIFTKDIQRRQNAKDNAHCAEIAMKDSTPKNSGRTTPS